MLFDECGDGVLLPHAQLAALVGGRVAFRLVDFNLALGAFLADDSKAALALVLDVE
jgi:hypothetical protein